VVEYRQGTLNVVADALSHQHEDSMGIHVISSPSFVVYDALRAELQASPEALQWRAELAANTAPPGWTEVDDLLLFKGRVLLPAASSLEQAHTMGHEGCEKTPPILGYVLQPTCPPTYTRVRDLLLGVPKEQD
jgi:hypothetical protein